MGNTPLRQDQTRPAAAGGRLRCARSVPLLPVERCPAASNQATSGHPATTLLYIIIRFNLMSLWHQPLVIREDVPFQSVPVSDKVGDKWGGKKGLIVFKVVYFKA